MKRFITTALPLSGLTLVERKRFADNRGFLERVFCAEELRSFGWTKPIAQINHAFTAKQGSVRGMHFQFPPHSESKLVSCIRGEVWDVAVDIRANSPTFMQWHAEHLSAENGRALMIPEGFAHGFQTLTDDVVLLYCHGRAYAATAEGGLNPADPRLAIQWPLAISDLSARDAGQPFITAEFEGVRG